MSNTDRLRLSEILIKAIGGKRLGQTSWLALFSFLDFQLRSGGDLEPNQDGSIRKSYSDRLRRLGAKRTELACGDRIVYNQPVNNAWSPKRARLQGSVASGSSNSTPALMRGSQVPKCETTAERTGSLLRIFLVLRDFRACK